VHIGQYSALERSSFCPVLRPNFANLLAIILVIFLQVIKALEVSFLKKKNQGNRSSFGHSNQS